MAPPPAKRQKRLISSSDDETESDTKRSTTDTSTRLKRPTKDIPVKNAARPQNTRQNGSGITAAPSTRKSSLRLTPTSSPEKRKSNAGKVETVKSKSLHSFFSKAPDEQRWSKKEVKTEEDHVEEVLEDIDEDSGDDVPVILGNARGQPLPLDRRKDVLRPKELNGSINPPSKSTFIAGEASTSVWSSQKFSADPRKPFDSTFPSTRSNSNADRRPWSDRYAPTNLEDLAVHKKKVTDVKAWLLDAFSHSHRRHLLILKGPAGSGKTIALSLLAKAMDFQLVEWRNSTTSDGAASTSFTTQFDDFLGRRGHFGSLDFESPSTSTSQATTKDEAGRTLLVVDEFPTTFTRSATALHAFRSSILRFLATNTGAAGSMFQSAKSQGPGSPPIVMIISETLLSSATASADSFTAHRLLGPEVSNHPCTHTIEFNPAAPTFISKALDTVIKKEARTTQRRRVPGPLIMKRLSEMGDIRSAVNSLEFLCLRGDKTGDWGGRVASKAKKGDMTTLTAMEQESIELVTQRESTLGMFHAVGKVVYNKRDEPGPASDAVVAPPDHLLHYHRPRTSQVVIEDLMNETGTDISTFVSSLHENYVLSCTGSAFVDRLNDCVDSLSDSDLLDTDSRRPISSIRGGVGKARANLQTGSTDLIRQGEINFDVAVRGLLFSLPYPVSRASHPTGRKGDSHKMFFPAGLRLWKKTEEIEAVLSMWRSRLEGSSDITLLPNTSSTTRMGSESDAGVASWKRSIFPAANTSMPNISEDNMPPRFVSAKSDLLLDWLPYFAKIQQARNLVSPDLRLVTQFDGIDPPMDEDIAGNDEDTGLIGVEDTTEARSSMVKTTEKDEQAAFEMLTQKMGAEALEEKLYISDDDIEDD